MGSEAARFFVHEHGRSTARAAADAADEVTREPVPHDCKTEALAAIIRRYAGTSIRKVLVVGCGSGREAAVLAQELGAEVFGIDIGASFDSAAATVAQLRRGDATRLEFDDGTFDLVYSFHVLEHIPDSATALAEMHRVLAAGGWYCIGTPNRLRLLGYMGSIGTPWRDKLIWNLADWMARLRGRFRNEFGAHAGFSSDELAAALRKVFRGNAQITADYYRGVYRRHATLLSLLDKLRLGRFIFPAVYFIGRK